MCDYLLLLNCILLLKLLLIMIYYIFYQLIILSYNFTDECQSKYGNANIWKHCCSVFDLLGIAAIIDGRVLCVHGGLSPHIKTIDQIRTVQRMQEIPHEGAFCDLMWSDPEDVDNWAVSPRGAGWLFGSKVTDEVFYTNKFYTYLIY